MKKPELLENKPDIIASSLLILLLLFISCFISFIEKSLLKSSLTVEKRIILGFSNTVFIESLFLLYIFKKYGTFLRTLFRTPSSLIKGAKTYFFIFPLLVISGFFNYSILKLLKKEIKMQEIFYLFIKADSLTLIIMLVFLSTILAPFFEEVLFRGIFYNSLRQKFSKFPSIFINGFIFSLFHQTLTNIIGIFLLGCFLAYLMEKHRNLWPCIGLHFFNNFFATAFVLCLKYLNQ